MFPGLEKNKKLYYLKMKNFKIKMQNKERLKLIPVYFHHVLRTLEKNWNNQTKNTNNFITPQKGFLFILITRFIN